MMEKANCYIRRLIITLVVLLIYTSTLCIVAEEKTMSFSGGPSPNIQIIEDNDLYFSLYHSYGSLFFSKMKLINLDIRSMEAKELFRISDVGSHILKCEGGYLYTIPRSRFKTYLVRETYDWYYLRDKDTEKWYTPFLLKNQKVGNDDRIIRFFQL